MLNVSRGNSNVLSYNVAHKNKHMVLLCLKFCYGYIGSCLCTPTTYSPTFHLVAVLALGQSWNYSRASEIVNRLIDKINRYQTTIKTH